MNQVLTPYQLEAHTVELDTYRRKCRCIPSQRVYSTEGAQLQVLSNNLFTADALIVGGFEVENFPMSSLRVFMPAWGSAC